MDHTQRFLKDLVNAHGAPGFEGHVARVMQGYLKDVGPITRDKLGSFICEKRGSSDGPPPEIRHSTRTSAVKTETSCSSRPAAAITRTRSAVCSLWETQGLGLIPIKGPSRRAHRLCWSPAASRPSS